MTPAEILYIVEGYNKKRSEEFELLRWGIHQAGVLNSYAFHDPKKYPNFEQFIYGRKRQQTPEEMLQVVKMLNVAFGGVDKTNPGI